ncbi:hypothetical protein [Dongshaea marina]|uniref:hypothetical protein n=1 Tax=Dongshaea marina TaxID=2047966 RepID=UPI000D3E8118|nr:hypothetical protein [Dongshaea marina]
MNNYWRFANKIKELLVILLFMYCTSAYAKVLSIDAYKVKDLGDGNLKYTGDVVINMDDSDPIRLEADILSYHNDQIIMRGNARLVTDKLVIRSEVMKVYHSSSNVTIASDEVIFGN